MIFAVGNMKRYAANIITGCRIAFSILLLMFPVFSFRFYAMYLASGITDMIDGTVARKTNSTSAFGSQFDTIADAVFLVSALLKLLPEIEFPAWALTWIVVIAVIKTANIAWGFIRQKRFIVKHTPL